jgi:hypothetical protein
MNKHTSGIEGNRPNQEESNFFENRFASSYVENTILEAFDQDNSPFLAALWELKCFQTSTTWEEYKESFEKLFRNKGINIEVCMIKFRGNVIEILNWFVDTDEAEREEYIKELIRKRDKSTSDLEHPNMQ